MDWVLKNGERLVDGATAFAAGYIVWFAVFRLPAVPVVHEFVAVGCCVAVGAAALKMARKARFW